MAKRKAPTLPLEELTGDRLAGEEWLTERRAAWGDEHRGECQVFILVTPSEAEALARGEVPPAVLAQVTTLGQYARGERH